jgi:hypothetical protein
MLRIVAPIAVALVGLSLLGLWAGDPRGAVSVDDSTVTTLLGLALALAVGALAWRSIARPRAAWLLAPTLLAASFGGLCGWIAGVEILGDTARAARLAAAPSRVAFLLSLTAAGMALPATAIAALLGRLTRRDRAET